MTTVLRDFRQSSYEASNIAIQTKAAHPYVFVIKKNKSVLLALIAWLKEQAAGSGGTLSVPVMMLDDESDYASVNTNYSAAGDKSPTAINAKIRELLKLTTRSSYMAFTATPFANVLIDHYSYDEALQEELFTLLFILAHSSPSNYVGGKYFGTSMRRSSLVW
jgi:hypothetical protein